MGYTEAPVYNDPPSNQWFGMQAWGMQRVAELYYASGNAQAKAILDKWVPWAVANITVSRRQLVRPVGADLDRQAGHLEPGEPGLQLRACAVAVKSTGQDVGVAGDTARTLLFYAAKSGNTAVAGQGQGACSTRSGPPTRTRWASRRRRPATDFGRFDDTYVAGGNGVYIPAGWTGTMPNGDVIKPGVSFLDIRSWYKQDPQWSKVQAYLDGGAAPTFNFHRFWAQTAIAGALADYDRLFSTAPRRRPTRRPRAVPTGLLVGTTTATSATISWTASTDNTGGSGVAGYDVYRGTTKVGSSTTTSYTDTGLTAVHGVLVHGPGQGRGGQRVRRVVGPRASPRRPRRPTRPRRASPRASPRARSPRTASR